MNETFNYYEAGQRDLISQLAAGFKKGTFYVRPDHKIGMRTGIMWDTPWLFRGDKPPTDRNCVLFHGVILPYFNFIPAKCQECWKVVARPRTVKELFEISELQKESDRGSKAGIEKRHSVGGNYGAYWYNDSIEEGEECRQFVIELVKRINPDIPVFLKRGCTEFEHKFGQSIDWKVTEESEKKEKLITDNLVIEDDPSDGQPWFVKDNVRRKWVEFAYERGDETYLGFTGGKHLYPKYVTYESKEDDV